MRRVGKRTGGRNCRNAFIAVTLGSRPRWNVRYFEADNERVDRRIRRTKIACPRTGIDHYSARERFTAIFFFFSKGTRAARTFFRLETDVTLYSSCAVSIAFGYSLVRRPVALAVCGWDGRTDGGEGGRRRRTITDQTVTHNDKCVAKRRGRYNCFIFIFRRLTVIFGRPASRSATGLAGPPATGAGRDEIDSLATRRAPRSPREIRSSGSRVRALNGMGRGESQR